MEGLRKYKNDRNTFEKFLRNINNCIASYPSELKAELGNLVSILTEFESFGEKQPQEPLRVLGEIMINDERVESVIREKDE